MNARSYCQGCYAPLDVAAAAATTSATGELSKCDRCGRVFNPLAPRTFNRRPFPNALVVVAQVVGTTALAVGAAYVVAFHQMARTSGH